MKSARVKNKRFVTPPALFCRRLKVGKSAAHKIKQNRNIFDAKTYLHSGRVPVRGVQPIRLGDERWKSKDGRALAAGNDLDGPKRRLRVSVERRGHQRASP
jgi:hypothetical protein